MVPKASSWFLKCQQGKNKPEKATSTLQGWIYFCILIKCLMVFYISHHPASRFCFPRSALAEINMPLHKLSFLWTENSSWIVLLSIPPHPFTTEGSSGDKSGPRDAQWRRIPARFFFWSPRSGLLRPHVAHTDEPETPNSKPLATSFDPWGWPPKDKHLWTHNKIPTRRGCLARV